MSNFFDFYIDELTQELSLTTAADVVDGIPVGDVSIVTIYFITCENGERGDLDFVLDFDSLPSEIKGLKWWHLPYGGIKASQKAMLVP